MKLFVGVESEKEQEEDLLETESSETQHSDGLVRCSDETPVMGVEQGD